MSRPVNTQDEEPVNFIDAKRNLVTRLNGYKERKINQNIKEQQQATGTDGDN
jgi:hypothetical protein